MKNYLKIKKFKIKNRHKGIATLPVVVAVVVLTLAVTIGITVMSLSEIFSSASSNQSSRALIYAESGAKDALIRIARNKDYTCDTPSSGCYQIEFVSSGCTTNDGCAKITVSAASSPKIIISEGRVKNNIRKIQVDVSFDASLNGQILSTSWQELTN